MAPLVADGQSGRLQEGGMRAGTVLLDRDAVPGLVQECRVAGGYAFDTGSGPVAKPGKAPHAFDWLDRLPRRKDYIIHRSRKKLEGILADGEWRGSRSELIEGRLRQTMMMRVN